MNDKRASGERQIASHAARPYAAKSVEAGDLKAIGPYLQILERFDRYRKWGMRKEVYDDAARKRLFAKLNRIAARLKTRDGGSANEAPASTPEAAKTPDSGLAIDF